MTYNKSVNTCTLTTGRQYLLTENKTTHIMSLGMYNVYSQTQYSTKSNGKHILLCMLWVVAIVISECMSEAKRKRIRIFGMTNRI